MENWQCFFCDNTNDSAVFICHVCEAEREDISEKEEVESYKRNDDEDMFHKSEVEGPFETCQIPISCTPDPKTCSNSHSFWSCVKCTMSNPYNIGTCSVCYHKGPHFDKWVCSQCTMLNDKVDANCSVCYSLNPSFKTCPTCNNIYSVKCEHCADAIEKSAESDSELADIVDAAPSGSWTCPKCSFMYSSNVDRCAKCADAAPPCDKIVCERCSYKNEKDAIMCSACAFLFNRNMTKFIGTMTLDTVRELIKVPNEKVRCRQCHHKYTCSDDKLCENCKRDYYICPNDNCQRILGLNVSQCVHCGFNKNQFDPIIDQHNNGWRCSWMKCQKINENDTNKCASCKCDRSENSVKETCKQCGWINFGRNKCLKCGINI